MSSRDYDRPNLTNKEDSALPLVRGKSRFHQIFEFNADTPMHDIEGNFCHESLKMSATPQLLEVLHEHMPETVELKVRAKDSEEVFEVFVQMKLVSLKKHYYERTDTKRKKWNAKDAKKNEKILGHLKEETEEAVNPKDCGLQELTAPMNEWA